MCEPTKTQKEIAFHIFLQNAWNNGPFTVTEPGKPKDMYATGIDYLDLLSSSAVTIVARSYGYGEEGCFGTRSDDHKIVGAEMMMLDFILLDLADELGYEFVEFQNDAHYQMWKEWKEAFEANGWIPYDGKGMPEGLEKKMIYIFCFGANETEFIPNSYVREGGYWSWHPADGEGYFNESCIAFYKIKE